ncbi:MAG: hypothetical protein WCO45_10065 [Pseudanabaena sp. ELA607]
MNLQITAERLKRASELACRQWSALVASDGICCPINQQDFQQLLLDNFESNSAPNLVMMQQITEISA